MNAKTRRFTRVSGKAEAILGYPAERWRNVPGFWIGVLHPEDRERVAQAVWRALREKTGCEIEYRAVAADGSVVTLRDRVQVVSGPDGDGLSLRGAITDLTARKPGTQPLPSRLPRRWRRTRTAKPVAALAHPAEPVPPSPTLPEPSVADPFAAEQLLSSLGEAVIASDSDHRIVYWNDAAERLLGVTADDAIGSTDADLLRARTSAGQTAEILAGLLGQRPWSAEVEFTGAGEVPVPVRVTASALRDGSRIRGYVAVITDLREVRRAEAARGAAAAMDAVARLAGGVAVELSEGVARVEAAVRAALARVPPDEASRRDLDEALRGVDAAGALGSQLLAVGRGWTPVPRATDLREVVAGGLPAIELLAGDLIDIVTRLDPATPAAWVDRSVASQILLNVASNAVGAMAGGGRLTVSVGVPDTPDDNQEDHVAEHVFLELRDTRELAAGTSVERFFEPFNEAASPPGMSLAAAHGLAISSGGRLTASAAPAGGVVFRLVLPAAAGEST